MFGGDLKISRFAILVGAGLLAGSVSAQAADLGGNCCADLEERVAELEATTARKGNRQVSLQIYGHVNEMIMAWDDGFEKNVYVGTNDDSRSRFGFKGKANINSDWSAGFVMEFGLRIARSDKWNQCSDNDARTFNCGAGDEADPQFDVRKSAWYLQSKTFGKITVGRESTVDSVAVNLANVNAPVYDDMNDDFGIRRTDGTYTGRRYDQAVAGWSYNPPSRTRQNQIRYDTPTFAGFQASAAWGEDDYWAVALAYAAEFGGFRLAAKAAYSWLNEPDSEGGCSATSQVLGTERKVDCEGWGVGASLMHTATGLFVTGSYGQQKDNLRAAHAVAPTVDDVDSYWMVMAGIEQRWNSLGKTTIYGTYYTAENNCGEFRGDEQQCRGTQNGRYAYLSTDMWSVGINQNIAAAAMDIYLAYYRWETDLKLGTGAGNPLVDDPTEPMQAIITGAKIKF